MFSFSVKALLDNFNLNYLVSWPELVIAVCYFCHTLDNILETTVDWETQVEEDFIFW